MKTVYLSVALFSAVIFGSTIPESQSEEEDFVLPEGIKTCDQDDPDLNQCIKDTIQEQIPLLQKGSKRLAIPALDPFEIPSNRYEYYSGPIGGILILKGVMVYGISKTVIKDVHTNISEDGLTSEIDAYFPRIFVEGNYKADIKVNELKMRPKGYFNFTMSEINVKNKMSGIFETINGKKHLKLTSFDVEPEIGDMKFYATGLFPDPALNSIILDFANQYWPEMLTYMLPQTKPTWEPMILEAANIFLAQVPFDKLLTKNSQ